MARTPKGQALGNALRQIREDRGLSGREFAHMIGRDQSELSRWETGDRTPKPEQVARILTKLEIDGERYDEILDLVYGAEESSWVATTLPAQRQQVEALANFEFKANKIVAVAPLLIPGLLQTSDYSRAIMEGAKVPENELATRLAVRIGRKQVITRTQSAVAHVAFIGRAALQRIVGSDAVMIDQYKFLLDMAKRDNIELRVLLQERDWDPSCEGAFDLIESKNTTVVFLENRRSALILHEKRDIRIYERAVGMVEEASMSPEESARIVAKIATRLESYHGNFYTVD